jgi:penicillin-binding protein 2
VEPRKRQDHTRSLRRIRGQWARVLVTVCALALVYSFVQIQLIGSEEYAVVARDNRLRPIVTRAPRGTIYDRYGQVVAENVVAYQVLLMPAPFDSIRSALDQLTPVLGLTVGDIAVALRRYRREPHLPLEVLRNASPGAVARLEERRFMFPGVLVHQYPKRRYPVGQPVGHLIGYVAEISREELELPEFRGYRQGRWIGKAGLERAYEDILNKDPRNVHAARQRLHVERPRQVRALLAELSDS